MADTADKTKRSHDKKMVPAPTLSDLQVLLRNDTDGRAPHEIAEDMRLMTVQLVSHSGFAETGKARGLVAARVLADLLNGIAEYCNARGWSADLLLHQAILGLNGHARQ